MAQNLIAALFLTALGVALVLVPMLHIAGAAP